jgi:hypothetical protein
MTAKVLNRKLTLGSVKGGYTDQVERGSRQIAVNGASIEKSNTIEKT